MPENKTKQKIVQPYKMLQVYNYDLWDFITKEKSHKAFSLLDPIIAKTEAST